MTSKDRPTALVLTRQGLPTIEGTNEMAKEGVERGAYIISKSQKETPEAVLLASGSEVHLAVQAQKVLLEEGIDVSVVSMPSWDRFEKQDQSYKDKVIPPHVRKRLAIEMAASLGWERYVGLDGDVLAIDRFGASAPGNKVMEEYGFTVENIVKKVKELLSK